MTTGREGRPIEPPSPRGNIRHSNVRTFFCGTGRDRYLTAQAGR